MSSPTRTSARVAAALILLLVPADARSQETSGRKTVRIAANPKYKASGFRRVFLGPNYRRLWATPIEVEVLDLGSFAGGLKPTKKGGGKQTKSLRFEGADGREFRVRSVDKDPEAALPAEYRDTFIEWVLNEIQAKHRRPRYAGRRASASTAVGQMSKHNEQLRQFLDEALG